MVLGIALLGSASAQVTQHSRQVEEPLARERLATIKALAVRHLPGHTEWSNDRFDDENDRLAPIIITVIGHDRDGFDRTLERAAAGARAHERAIVVRRIEFPRPPPGDDEPAEEDLERFRQRVLESHVLYIGLTEAAGRRYLRVIDMIEGRGILTVSYIAEFVLQGGMLRLTVRENRLAMDANINLIRDSDLRISSSLLRLARIVIPTDRSRGEGNGQ